MMTAHMRFSFVKEPFDTVCDSFLSLPNLLLQGMNSYGSNNSHAKMEGKYISHQTETK